MNIPLTAAVNMHADLMQAWCQPCISIRPKDGGWPSTSSMTTEIPLRCGLPMVHYVSAYSYETYSVKPCSLGLFGIRTASAGPVQWGTVVGSNVSCDI